MKDEPPICECGQPGVDYEGEYWICGNPSCDGWGQVLREIRRPGTPPSHPPPVA